MKKELLVISVTLLLFAACERAPAPVESSSIETRTEKTVIAAPAEPSASVAPLTPDELRVHLQEATGRYFATADESMHLEIVGEIAELGEAEGNRAPVAETLGALFVGTRDADTKIDILDQIIEVHSPASFYPVASGLQNTQPKEVRLATIAALQFLEDQRAPAQLQPLITDPDSEIREAAQDAIEGFKQPSTAGLEK